jgi:hypothetical protein
LMSAAAGTAEPGHTVQRFSTLLAAKITWQQK